MMLATKTLAAVEAALVKDQGAKFRGLLGKLVPQAGDAYSTKEDDWRDHLGASLIGRECPREIWYGFRWATLQKFDGRMIRLFNRGHLEEPRFIALLEMIGCQVWQLDANGKQFRISGHKKHFGGSLDAVVLGIPDLPDQPVLAEFKTHGEKSFIKLVATGVLSAKWEHFIQMQIYMGKNDLKWAIYCAVSKNTDELHLEILQFDPVQYQRYLDRSKMIIEVREPPPKINASPGWFKCKFCSHKGVCHGDDLPAINCRTCSFVEIGDDGAWICKNNEVITLAEIQGWEDPIELDASAQRKGCEFYVSNPVFKNKV